VASAGPYANHLHLASTDKHTSTSPLSFHRPDALPAAQPTASKHQRLQEISRKVGKLTQKNDNKTASNHLHRLRLNGSFPGEPELFGSSLVFFDPFWNKRHEFLLHDAMEAQYMLCPASACLSDVSQSSIKTAKYIIVHTTWDDSPGILVLQRQRSR